jgi:hypothetical protein
MSEQSDIGREFKRSKKIVAAGLAAIAFSAGMAANARDSLASSSANKTELNTKPRPDLVKAQKVFAGIRDILNVVIVIPELPEGAKHNKYFYEGPDVHAPKLTDAGSVLKDPGDTSGQPYNYEMAYPLYTHVDGQDWLAYDESKGLRSTVNVTHLSPEGMETIVWQRASDLPKGTQIYQLKGTPAGSKHVIHGTVGTATGELNFRDVPGELYGALRLVPADQTDSIQTVSKPIKNLTKFIHGH